MKCEFRSLPSMKNARNRVDKAPRVIDSKEIPARLALFAKGKRFFIRTFGCQANIRDEEVMAGYLSRAGFKRTFDPKEADLAIINTCAVRENAEDKVYGEIGSFKANHLSNPSFLLCVCGCMMQEEKVAEKITKTYPFVNLVFGTHNIPRLLSLLNDVILKKERIIDVISSIGEVVEGLPSIRLNDYEAFVNISYGCDKFCTYCIVPYTRGRERSRAQKDIVRECKALVEEGYKQITLLGQNVNSYGLDLHDGTTFAGLLEEVAKLGIPRLRFLTSYPSQFDEETMDIMATYPNIMKWLHFPVQSGSTSCLKRMGRRYSREQYLDLVDKIRAKMPSIALTTDIIVGFPNETDEEFSDTLSLCERVQYSSAFTFIYSPRKGTPAANIVDNVSSEKKHERFDALKATIEKTTSAHSEAMIGHTYDILVTGPSKRDKTILSGYAENGKLVNFKGPSYLTGAIVPVKITESHTYSLLGELTTDPLILKAKDVAYTISVDPLFKEFTRLLQEANGVEIKALGEKYIEKKKELALAIGDPQKHAVAKKEYEEVLSELKNNPVLENIESLTPLIENELLRIKGILE